MADTSPVAHEGNPKEDSITISGGDVLSTATLSVVLPFVPAEPPPIPPPPPIQTLISASNPLKYVLTDFIFGLDGQNSGSGTPAAFEPNNANDSRGAPYPTAITNITFVPTNGTVLEYSSKDDVRMSGAIISGPVQFCPRYIDNTLGTGGITQFPSGLEPFAKKFSNLDFWDTVQLLNEDVQTLGDHARWGSFPTNGGSFQIRMESHAYVAVDAHGLPFSGVAVGVKPDSTFNHFTGIVSAYDWGSQVEYLMRYRDQSLAGLGEIISSHFWGADYTVADGTPIFLRIAKGRTIIGVGNENWNITNNAASTGFTLSDSDIPYFAPDMRVALVNLNPLVASGTDDYVVWREVSGKVNSQ